MSDQIVFGAECTWWGTSAEAPDGVCPQCGGQLNTLPDEAAWQARAQQIAAESVGLPVDYVELVGWLRGRCLPSLDAAVTAYQQEVGP